MATQEQPNAAGIGYKRASRKNAERRFPCEKPGCGKVYTRAEHLQRHQLNHDPKRVWQCDVPSCQQQFVRHDLLVRHQKRHSATYVPRNRASSFTVPQKDDTPVIPSLPGSSPSQPGFSPSTASAPRNAAILMAPDPSSMQSSQVTMAGAPANNFQPPWTPPVDGVNFVRPKPGYYTGDAAPIHDASTFVPFGPVSVGDPNDLARDNFAMWLFDPNRNFADFSVTGMPFLEGGLESPFNNHIHYDHESLTSRSAIDLTPPQQSDLPDTLISEFRRQEILRWIHSFRQKQSKYESSLLHLFREIGNDLPGISLQMLQDCVQSYWESVSPRMPIVHQATFMPSQCSTLLLLVIIALGAASLHQQDSGGSMQEYGPFADLIITCVRWEILPADEASPPVELWVAQALLLLEFYEKMYSSRKLHERAHIYHSATLTLLRRGSPLIGRSGSESPPDEQNGPAHPIATDAKMWWVRWAETESMHRVVFAAFMMDVTHAAMFGHAANMAPHEIRLPLPCDDVLWFAASPESVRQQDSTLRMYGVRPVSFLDGLKRAIHGDEVKTHSFGRMIIMCGLLSVGWHLSHRETHLKWLELDTSASDTREKWRNMSLKAFDGWKSSFDKAMGSVESDSTGPGQRSGANGLIQSAAVLYHLAHISLYVDIVDCQVYAGAKRVLGRKVSTRDYANVVTRMRTWASQPTTRHAVLHAFKLLYRVLVESPQRKPPIYPNTDTNTFGIQYSCRNDSDPHRPWITYYATLTIWSFVKALQQSRNPSLVPLQYSPQLGRSVAISEYLSNVARHSELDVASAATLREGVSDLLDTVGRILSESHSELLQEAQGRLEVCKEMLGNPSS